MPDKNHSIPRDFFEALGCAKVVFDKKYVARVAWYRSQHLALLDTSKIGGFFPDYMLLVILKQEWYAIEVKTARAYKKTNHGLTEGELWMSVLVDERFKIVVTPEDFQRIMDEAVEGD